MPGIAHRWLYAAAVISAVVLAPAAAAGEIDAPAQVIMEAAFPADGPGGAAIVTRNDEVVFESARGLADIGTGRVLDVDTARSPSSSPRRWCSSWSTRASCRSTSR
jgi:hypothetical protein